MKKKPALDRFMTSEKIIQKNVWISSWVLSISLLGDALLYVVLPVNAEAFGVSMVAVGLLLAINRIIRTFTYGLIVEIGQFFGARKLVFIASTCAAASTLGYGLFDSIYLLILSRVLWGLSYAGLLVATLYYASINYNKTGSRIGISRSIEQVGPLTVMVLGTWLAATIGPKEVFIYLAWVSALGILLAFFLIEIREDEKSQRPVVKRFSIAKPKPIDGLIFWMGFGIDGVFTVTIALLWLQYSDPETAVIIGGIILAARRTSEMIIAPFSGRLSDILGGAAPLFSMLILCGIGFALLGVGSLILGSVALVICRGALGTLFPAAASKLYAEDPLHSLTRNQTWRDIGAAAGPLLTGVLLSFVSVTTIYFLMFILFAITSYWFIYSGEFKRLSQVNGMD